MAVRKTSFYYAFLVLPAPQRRAITAVFDFCRAVDDSVDLETDPARAASALETWRAEVARVFGAGAPQTTQGRQLLPFAAGCRLPRDQFDALVDGVAMDASPRRYGTFADLEPYCQRVASSVGLICAAIFDCREPGHLAYARDLGVALQLTNILRDVAVDYRRGRCYVPAEDFERFRCAEADVQDEIAHAGRGVRSPRVRALLEHQAARARVFFSRAAHAFPPAAARRLVAAEIMGAVYADLLRRIEGDDFDVFTRVVRVPRPAQARLALKVWWRSRA